MKMVKIVFLVGTEVESEVGIRARKFATEISKFAKVVIYYKKDY